MNTLRARQLQAQARRPHREGGRGDQAWASAGAAIFQSFVRPAGSIAAAPAAAQEQPICAVGPGQRCLHALTDKGQNERLYAYERGVQERFGAIVPALQEIAALQHERDFVGRAQTIAETRLGFGLPPPVLADAWIKQLDMRALYAWCVFRTYLAVANQQIETSAAEQNAVEQAKRFFLDCGFHEVDISPCADGRLKGLERFVLRLPLHALRSTKAYAGALFDVEGDLARWQRIELRRHRAADPNPAGEDTRYLKVAVYHLSSSKPCQEGCAAHGSDEGAAAAAALHRLNALRRAVEVSFPGATLDILLIGVDTDTDSIKIHLPDGRGAISLARYIDSAEVYRATLGMAAENAGRTVDALIDRAIGAAGAGQGEGEPRAGMRRFITHLLVSNLAQIEYVIHYHGGRYADIGHQECFIAVGANQDAIQLRNLAYYAHLDTVEEGAADVDVGVKIFRGLNVAHGLPIPVVVHYRYNEQVPGSRERAIERCRRVGGALLARHAELAADGLLHCAMTVRGKAKGSRLELIEDPAVQGH